MQQSPRVWLDLAHAQAALLVAQATVWMRPVGQLIGNGSEDPDAAMVASTGREIPPSVHRLASAVRNAARYGLFRPKCLVRSVALNGMLRRSGIEGSRIRIGVRTREGHFEAHAWVELHGRVLGDRRDHVRNFVPLADVRLMEG